MGRLEGKVTMITGGASGIGEADAKLFAREGAKVVVADLNKEAGEEVVSDIRKEAGDAFFVKLDVSQESAWKEGIAETLKTYGKLNVLVNNAGIIIIVPLFEDTTLEQWNKIMSVNATGVFLGTKYAIKAMKDNGELCSIINRSSCAARAAGKSQAIYGASKGAVSALTIQAAVACAEAGYRIRINAVLPAEVNTPMAKQEARDYGIPLEKYLEEQKGEYPLGRIGNPIDIAYLDLYLASDESTWVTGVEYVIDGGLLGL